jgi:uncharacterized protein YutE (UPF0331/DUF86 family)
MPEFDSLRKAQFGAIQFPIKSVRVRCSSEKFVHVYLRVAGGVIEKLQRGLYMIEMDAVFDVNIKGYGQTPLWPNGLKSLREAFERQDTLDLVVPTIGVIPAMLDNWDQFADMAKVRSGETSKLQFIEDNSAGFLQSAQEKVLSTTVENSANTLKLTAKDFGLTDPEKDVFEKIQDQVNKIFSYNDQSDLMGGLLTARIESATAIIKEADSSLEALKHPENLELIQALHALWEALIDFGANLANSPRGARFYFVPSTMSVSDVAVAIYGNTSRASEILLNNVLPDPYAIEAGTQIIYFVG